MQLTEQEQQQVNQGNDAERLMTDPFFGFFMTEMGNAYLGAITASKPEQTTEREGLYHSLKALQDIGATLNHWVQVKNAIMTNAETAETETE